VDLSSGKNGGFGGRNADGAFAFAQSSSNDATPAASGDEEAKTAGAGVPIVGGAVAGGGVATGGALGGMNL
jgi:hypothetical protein